MDDAGTHNLAGTSEREACLGLILELRSRGIRDTRVLGAIERVPRRLFLSARQHVLAYVNTQLPIECGQTTSAPHLIARMVEALQVEPGHRVLHIGAGSGYQTAILAHLATEVVAIERYRTLLDLADQRLATLKLRNVKLRHGDGLLGDAEAAPFDGILLSGAVEAIPPVLLDQVREEGMLVAPVGPAGQEQRLIRSVRRKSTTAQEDLGPTRIVPLAHGVATRL